MKKIQQMTRTEKLALLKGLKKKDPTTLQTLQEMQKQTALLTTLQANIATVYLLWDHPELASIDPIDKYYLSGTSQWSREYLVNRYHLDPAYITNDASLAWPCTLDQTILEEIIDASIHYHNTDTITDNKRAIIYLIMLYETQQKLAKENQVHLLIPYLDNPRFQQIFQQYGSA